MSKMSELKRKILDALFWIFLIISIVLILWRIFGDSPSEISIIVSIAFMMMFKMWDISDSLRDFKYDIKSSFRKVKEDINKLSKKGNK